MLNLVFLILVKMITTHEHGSDAIPDIYRQNNNVFLVICRKVNGNVVIFEALLDKNRNIKQIDKYWLDLDPVFKTKALKIRGTTRDEFSMIDKYAYDIVITGKKAKEWTFHFKRFPSQELTIVVHDKKVSCFTVKNNSKIKIHHIYVYMKKNSTIIVPLVDFIRIIGVTVNTKETVSFDIPNNFF